MLAWDDERERQNVEFNITESNPWDDLRVSHERLQVSTTSLSSPYLS